MLVDLLEEPNLYKVQLGWALIVYDSKSLNLKNNFYYNNINKFPIEFVWEKVLFLNYSPIAIASKYEEI